MTGTVSCIIRELLILPQTARIRYGRLRNWKIYTGTIHLFDHNQICLISTTEYGKMKISGFKRLTIIF
jgi:hypothetical protein